MEDLVYYILISSIVMNVILAMALHIVHKNREQWKNQVQSLQNVIYQAAYERELRIGNGDGGAVAFIALLIIIGIIAYMFLR